VLYPEVFTIGPKLLKEDKFPSRGSGQSVDRSWSTSFILNDRPRYQLEGELIFAEYRLAAGKVNFADYAR
jgi:hypothetical protein